MNLKRSNNTNFICVKEDGKVKFYDKNSFYKKHSVDGVIRVTSKEFNFYKKQNRINHFNLEKTPHKKDGVYLIIKILKHGYFDGKDEVLPVLELKSAIKFRCFFAKNNLKYEDKLNLEFSPYKNKTELKKEVLDKYSKSITNVSKKELEKRGVAITKLRRVYSIGSTRSGFGKGLLESGVNKNVYALTADLGGSTKVMDFAKNYPERFVQVGVAEQNLVTVASGLAHMGKIPVATSFAAFSPGRNLEQIRTTICYNNKNVKICSTHTGLGVGEDGATHQAFEDIAQMRSLPNMIVVQPCDFSQAKEAIKTVIKHKGPSYLRLHRQNTATVTNNLKFELGKIQLIEKGFDVLLIVTGPLVEEALKAKDLLEESLSVEVVNCHTIKPLDEKGILSHIKNKKMVLTIEDHQVIGGLGSAVAELIAEKNVNVKFKRLGIQDSFGESGPFEELQEKYGLTAKSIVKEIKKLR